MTDQVTLANGRTLLFELDRFDGWLRAHRFAWSNEDDLQEALVTVFEKCGLSMLREHPLGTAGRVDFFMPLTMGDGYVGGIAVEVKVHAGPAEVLRQLYRYAEHKDVLGVVLITPSLRLRTPPELASKPTRTVHIPRLS